MFSIISGLMGFLGGMAPKLIEIYTNKQKLEEKKVDQAHELALFDKQMALAKELQTIEKERAEYVSDNELRQASYNLNTGIEEASQWVQNINSFVRPAITLFLVVVDAMASYFFVQQTPMLVGLHELTVMAVSWWFGSRAASKMK